MSPRIKHLKDPVEHADENGVDVYRVKLDSPLEPGSGDVVIPQDVGADTTRLSTTGSAWREPTAEERLRQQADGEDA